MLCFVRHFLWYFSVTSVYSSSLSLAQDGVHSQLWYRSLMITWRSIPITFSPFSIFFIILLSFIILLLYHYVQLVQGCDLWRSGPNFNFGHLWCDLGQGQNFGQMGSGWQSVTIYTRVNHLSQASIVDVTWDTHQISARTTGPVTRDRPIECNGTVCRLQFLVYRHASHLSRVLSFSFRIPC